MSAKQKLTVAVALGFGFVLGAAAFSLSSCVSPAFSQSVAMDSPRVLWSWNYEGRSYGFFDGRRVTVQRSNGDTWEHVESLGEIASAGVRAAYENPSKLSKVP